MITDLQPVATILTDLHRAAEQSGVKIMLVGAAARDLLIRHVVGSAPERATADVDIAVAASCWPDIDRLTNGLERKGGSVHKFIVRGVEVDVIPFGAIESRDRTIMWSNDHMMDVFGFREALAAAVDVQLPGGLVVSVASLPAQSLLKLLAWRDRRYQTKRDAIDLKVILRAYHEGRYFEELYAAHEELLEKHDFDPYLAGAERLGREAEALIASGDKDIVRRILHSEDLFEMLVGDMGGGGSLNLNHALVSAYRDGFN